MGSLIVLEDLLLINYDVINMYTKMRFIELFIL